MKTLSTPYLRVDLDILKKNVKQMTVTSHKSNLRLMPHAKTHKCAEIAKLLIKSGAKGISVAKYEEAVFFMNKGIKFIKICYPMISEKKIIYLLKKAKTLKVKIFFVIDSDKGFTILQKIVNKLKIVTNTYIEIDVGFSRCGLNISNPSLNKLAIKIKNSKNILLTGITSHAGHIYGAKNKKEVLKIAERERLEMIKVKKTFLNLGIKDIEICIGSTPAAWVQKNYQEITEIKPGNFVFNDLTQKHIGVVNWSQLALTVCVTVVSKNQKYLIIDAGSKSLSSDLGAHGSKGLKGYGLGFIINTKPNVKNALIIKKLSEEHGWILNNNNNINIGDELIIYPNHACAVVNLFDKMNIFKKNKFLKSWKVSARGHKG